MPTILPHPEPSHSDYVTHFRARVLQDALAEATVEYWRRRAETFEWAKPRHGERHGESGQAELNAAWTRCDESARACRAYAGFLVANPPITTAELVALIKECA